LKTHLAALLFSVQMWGRLDPQQNRALKNHVVDSARLKKLPWQPSEYDGEVFKACMGERSRFTFALEITWFTFQ
jgi:hypothetical protein